VTYLIEYLGEFESIFETILDYESEYQMGSFDAKNLPSKISCLATFKGSLREYDNNLPHLSKGNYLNKETYSYCKVIQVNLKSDLLITLNWNFQKIVATVSVQEFLSIFNDNT
jgi:hypothetical protein